MEPPLVAFVPGFMQRGSAWGPVAERVGERYPTLCVDSADDVPPGGVAVGYSMGGRLALRRALAEPSAFPALVVVGASAGIDDPAEREARRAGDEELAAWIEASAIEDVVARWESQPVFADQPAELVEAQRAGRLSHSPAELARTLRAAGQGALEPVWDRVPSLALPLLAMAGERDEPYVAAAHRLAAAAPLGRAAIIAGSGHAPQLEHPRVVAAELLAFLDDVLDGHLL